MVLRTDPLFDAPKQVFMLATPAHMLQKLYWEIKQLENALLTEHRLAFIHAPAYHAFNCAVTAWHLSDWVWESLNKDKNEQSVNLPNLSKKKRREAFESFQARLRAKHRSLHLCQQIANGSKHMNIHKPDPEVRVEAILQPQSMAGCMQAGQPLGLYLYRLSVTDKGQTMDALDVFRHAFRCWENELAEMGFC